MQKHTQISAHQYFIISIVGLLSITFLPLSNSFANNTTEVLLNELELLITQKEEFQAQKLQRISFLKSELLNSNDQENKKLEYDLTVRLYEEYQSFIYDSAFKYVIQMIDLANQLDNPKIVHEAKIQLGFTFLSSGLFKESLDSLLSLNSQAMNIATRIDYYNVLARTYYDLGDYHGDSIYSTLYTQLGNQIIDSALQLLSDTTEQYWMAFGLRRMKSDDFENAANAFNYVASQFEISVHDYAISTSSLGWIYTVLGRDNDAINMLINAAIADIKTSTKETVAFRNLAVHLYNQNNLDLAYKYINIALENANYYNARHRKMEISEVMPIIEGKRLNTLENQRKQLINYGAITTLLIIIVTLFSLIIYKQLKKLRTIRKILQETNNNLQAMNDNLLETNKIKEEYIGYFFNANSEFIDKLEAFQKTIQRKVIARQFDDIGNVIKSNDLHKEREKLFENFDRIFLKLFPHFVEKFNLMFNPEDQMIVEQKDLLNTDLRIFALIRLGISDNEKIANFLNYSVNTIYTYKTKLKNKTIVPRNEFYKHIMAIRAL